MRQLDGEISFDVHQSDRQKSILLEFSSDRINWWRLQLAALQMRGNNPAIPKLCMDALAVHDKPCTVFRVLAFLFFQANNTYIIVMDNSR